MAAASKPLAAPSEKGMRIAIALMVSVALHGIVLSTHFIHVNPRMLEDSGKRLDVVLVNAKTREAPLKPDVLAQVSHRGGGETDAGVRAKSPLPAGAAQADNIAAAQAQVKQLEEEARQLMSQLKQGAPLPSPPAAPAPTPAQNAQTAPSAGQLLQQGRNVARLEAEISRQWSAYQKRPRLLIPGINAKGYVFAAYISDWVAKIERVGNNNYPEAAKRLGIYGSLVMSVSIRADGSLAGVEIDRPSGSKILDTAAQNIVHLAAPFAPFPADIRKQGDVLVITRTWTFTRSDRMSGAGD